MAVVADEGELAGQMAPLVREEMVGGTIMAILARAAAVDLVMGLVAAVLAVLLVEQLPEIRVATAIKAL
mgnify:CR=1 FL=1